VAGEEAENDRVILEGVSPYWDYGQEEALK